LNQIKESDY